jgi:hypothetical protein
MRSVDMRATAIGVAVLAATTFAPAASASVRIARVATLDPFGADAQPAAYVSYKGITGSPGQLPYTARMVLSKNDRDDSISALGSSILPFQISPDPLSGTRKRLVYSQCLTFEGTSTPTCAILAQDTVAAAGDTPRPAALSDPTAGVQDRLPSGYGGAAAFARSTPGSTTDEVRYTPAGSGVSRHLHGGPRGMGSAKVTGVALRGTTVAYVWTRKLAGSRTRYTLFTERVGQPRRTIVSLDSTRGRILGPVWHGARVAFAVRHAGTSRLYDYAPASQTFRSAAGPSMLAVFSIGGSNLLWVTAPDRTLSRGTCGASGCPLLRGGLPAFKPSRPPH